MNKLFQIPFWGRGFRPFFFLGSLYSAFSIILWGSFYAGKLTLPELVSNPIAWHAHEMVFGFSIAIVAGFLLTAVANWTGGAPARHLHLAALCGLWGLGRLVVNIDLHLPSVAIAIIDSSFLPALAATLAIPLIKSRNKRNFVFLGLLTILFVCNISFYISQSLTPITIAMLVIVTMISVIGGRIIPGFTVAGLRAHKIEIRPMDQTPYDIAALVSLLLLMATTAITGLEGTIPAIIAGISCIIHAIRIRGYHSLKTRIEPMLWILHVGYAWVVIGLGLICLSAIGFVPLPVAIHALTAGAIGSMTIGMMCRVALGHTGRMIHATFTTRIMFVLMQAAAGIRVFGPLILTDLTQSAIVLSAGLWSCAYLIYAWTFYPILKSDRPDGQTV